MNETATTHVDGAAADGSDDADGGPEPGSAPRPRRERSSEPEADHPPPAPEGETAVEFSPRSLGAQGLDLDWIESSLRKAIDRLDRPVRRISVGLLDDGQMARLHRRHCGLGGTTDVLTFPASEPGAPIEVETAVCVDEARRQARAADHPVERELLLYCLHSLLHCAGFDDRTAAGFDAMHAREDEILESIGIGSTFRPAPADRFGDHLPPAPDHGPDLR